MNPALRVARIDLDRKDHVSILLNLLDRYARDIMGGGQALAEDVLASLPERLRAWPGYVGLIAFDDDEAVGLLNAFAGFSTFAARPLLNVHDIMVAPAHRRRGVGQALLAELERIARDLGCCKLTLEVLSNNEPALASYARFGFAPYQLDPQAGQALFLQKWLDDRNTTEDTPAA
ncbi:MAG: GNAT family N-acetyltransferase [Moraxellaceae bacterium]|nr:GNAT family N-acetyltransferase [Moraxellaceae bacterium]